MTMRQALVSATKHEHEALHHHAWISQLAKPSLTDDTYRRVMGAYCHFYRAVEERRSDLEVFRQLSLNDAVLRLDKDCIGSPHFEMQPPLANAAIRNVYEVLGALYVLHGAQFGAAVLKKNVSLILPNAPSNFLSKGLDVASWKNLNQRLESFRHDKSAVNGILVGASQTFVSLGTFTKDYCDIGASTKAPENAGSTRAVQCAGL